MNYERRKEIDLLIDEFWKKGYQTLFRKYGTYLPEPSDIGGFEVDVIAKFKKDLAIGITLLDQDFLNPSFVKNKLTYLANRQTRTTNRKVRLFVAVPTYNYRFAKDLLSELDPDTRRNIKLLQIADKPELMVESKTKPEKVLFS